jgi:hypothetical protein
MSRFIDKHGPTDRSFVFDISFGPTHDQRCILVVYWLYIGWFAIVEHLSFAYLVSCRHILCARASASTLSIRQFCCRPLDKHTNLLYPCESLFFACSALVYTDSNERFQLTWTFASFIGLRSPNPVRQTDSGSHCDPTPSDLQSNPIPSR